MFFIWSKMCTCGIKRQQCATNCIAMFRLSEWGQWSSCSLNLTTWKFVFVSTLTVLIWIHRMQSDALCVPTSLQQALPGVTYIIAVTDWNLYERVSVTRKLNIDCLYQTLRGQFELRPSDHCFKSSWALQWKYSFLCSGFVKSHFISLTTTQSTL